MRKFLLPIFLFLSGVSFSQVSYTAFEDAKQLVKWYKQPDTASAKSMLTLLLYYADNDNNKLTDSVNNLFLHRLYKKVNAGYSSIIRKGLTPDAVVTRIVQKENEKLPDEIGRLKNAYLELQSDYGNIKKQIEKIRAITSAVTDTQIVADVQILIELASQDAAVKNLVTSVSMSEIVAAIRDSSAVSDNLFDQLAKSVDKKMSDELDEKKKEIFDAVKLVTEKELLVLFPEFQINGKSTVRKDIEKFENNQSETQKAIIKIQLEREQAINATTSNLVDLNFPNQSDVIDAIGIYLAKRTKQEAALFFLETLVRTLRTNQLAQDLFPNTWRVMQTMETYTTPRFGAQWRNAIANDFINLPQNIKASAYIESRVPNKVLYDHFSDAVTFAGYVGKKYSFPDVVRTLYTDHSLLRGKWTNIAVDALQIINTELSTLKPGELSWIRPESFLSLDSAETYCLFDLLRLRYQDEVSVPMQQLFAKTRDIRGRVQEFKRFFAEVLTSLKQFQSVQKDASAKANDGTIMAPDGFWDTQRNLLDFLLTQKIIRLSTKETQALNLSKSVFFIYDHLSNKNYVGAVEHVVTIVTELLKKNATQLIHVQAKALARLQTVNPALYDSTQKLNQQFNDLGMLQRLTSYSDRLGFTGLPAQNLRDSFEFEDKTLYQRLIVRDRMDKDSLKTISTELRRNLKNIYRDLRLKLPFLGKDQVTYLFKKAGELNEDMLNVAAVVSSKENNRYFKWLADFAGLLTEIAITKKSDELANVIESYALPPGSYRMKRNADFSVDLNAFTGFYVGAEKVKNLDGAGLVYGLTAPIGIAFSWGGTDDKITDADRESDLTITRQGVLRRRTQNSFTLDFTLVDLGAVVSYRFTGGAEGLPTKPRWDQVISLGLNARWGIKKTPFCIGLGFMQTPKLRTINKEQERAYRAQVSFAFDLPLINIYRRS